MAAVFLGAAPKPAPLITYGAPAGDKPAGADGVHPTNAILPDGRTAAPAGTSIFVGTNPLGMAMSPDGKFIVISNDDQRTGGLPIPASEPPLAIGYSLTVVDTRSMTVTSVYHDASAAFYKGVAVVTDPADASHALVLASDGANGVVRLFALDGNGQLTAMPQSVALPAPQGRHAFPAGIAIAPGGRTAYVVDNVNAALIAIDIASRTAAQSIPIGYFPLDVAIGGNRLLATGSGLSGYSELARPERDPRFIAPAFDASRSSTLDVMDLSAAAPQPVLMDAQPDGVENIGGAAPGAIAISRDGNLAYVALANVDRVAVVTLKGAPRVARGLDLRLFSNAPYGAAPSAEALSRDGKRLYVALAGLNSVAVLDAKATQRYRYGLLPTGWYPVALALGSNDKMLFVLDAKGVDGWGMLQRIDLKHTSMVKATLDALRFNRTVSVAKYSATVPPLRSGKGSEVIDHVVYIAVGTASYDAMLGDLHDASGAVHGNGEASFCIYPQNVTPNLHALALSYALADNFYAADNSLDVARQFATGGDATLFTQLTAHVNSGRAPLQGYGEDPEDYGRAGYFFNAMARAGLSYRDYGGLLRLSGYSDALYHLDVPALAALKDNVDLNYAGWNPKVDDAHRAQEFENDMRRFVDADAVPRFTYVWLPTNPRQGGVAEADRALGSIVSFISQTPHWSSTAIFIVPEGLDNGTDHVNPMRSYALVVSPLARRGFVGHAHLSVASVVKTEDELLNLPPLALADLLATDMADFFVDVPQPEPYQAIR